MEFTHFNESGRAKMVDVSEKAATERIAKATGKIILSPQTIGLIKSGGIKKGDVLSVAQVAGIMAAKKTSETIPMCHNIFLTGCDISFEIMEDSISISATAKTLGQTGVEMEALTAVSAAALTIYDMCKAVDKAMCITNIHLAYKKGGRTGEYQECKE